jgi:sterol desaturase/sphingolipid hydroxylase (fatty acid hydroxylase superfamily)
MRLGTFGYYADFFGGFLCCALLCAAGMLQRAWLERVEWLLALIIGLGLWTLMEYGIHRWLYHGLEVLMRLHDAHHKEPNAHIGAPPFVGIALIFLIVYLPVGAFSPTFASGLTTGVMGGYLAYQVVHHAAHFWQAPRGSYLYRARVRHAGHHYHRVPGNFGITTLFWDQIFGTAIVASRNAVATAPAGDA